MSHLGLFSELPSLETSYQQKPVSRFLAKVAEGDTKLEQDLSAALLAKDAKFTPRDNASIWASDMT